MKQGNKLFCDYCGEEITGEYIKRGKEEFCSWYHVMLDEELDIIEGVD